MRTAQETSRRNSSTTGYRPDAVQRKCACGGSSSLETECEHCKRNKIDVQRYSARREAPDTLISRFVIGSRIALPDSSDNPSALGHNFSQIRVHQNTKPTLQTKLRARVPSEPHEEEADRIASLVTQPLQAANAVRQEPIESSRVQLAVQRAPGDRSEQSSEAGKEAMPQTATPTEKSAARSLIVEDRASVLPGQMRKTEFLDQMEREVCAAADAELAAAGRTAQGCPYIRNWLGFYRTQSSQHVERALRRYAPEAANASGARDYIPIVAERVRRAARVWAETGQITGLPAELAGQLPGAGFLGAVGGILSGAAGILGGMFGGIGRAFSGIFTKAREGGASETADPAQIKHQLGSGQSLDSNARSRMESAFGHDFSRVRIHTDSRAADLSDDLNARAFTIGSDVAFAAGEYRPGTVAGDALLAHELAHVVQQGVAIDQVEPLTKTDSLSNAPEDEADDAAASAVMSLWTAGNRTPTDRASVGHPSVGPGLRLQRCGAHQAETRTAGDAKAQATAQPKQPVVCEPNRKLTWADFTGAPRGSGSAKTRFHHEIVTEDGKQIIRAFFDPDSSWVRPAFGDPTNRSNTNCEQRVTGCERFFDKEARARRTGGTQRLAPGTGCAASPQPNQSVVATSRGECDSKLGTECDRVAKLESERLLRHEQLHLDIACVIAKKGTEALVTRPKEAKKILESVKKIANDMSDDNGPYDQQTRHGCDATAQATWEADVSSGLPKTTIP